MTEDPVPWLSRDRDRWWADVARWVGDVAGPGVGEQDLDLEAVKLRPWGAVLRFGPPGQHLYFKAVGPHGRHEVRLLVDLDRRGWPGLVPELVAVDASRGWLVMADHGSPMRDLTGAEQVAVLETLLPRYAEMQATTVHLVAGWLGAGTPDRRVGRLPGLLDRLLSGHGQSGPLPIDDEERRAHGRLLGELERVCEDLASSPSSTAVDHADMHGTNVLVKDGRGCLIDWGDACITHPFSSLLVPHLFVVPLLAESERRVAALRLRDSYLEPWGSPPDRRATLGMAVWCGYVARAISVDHQSVGAPPGELDEIHAEIVGLLRRWSAKRGHLAHPDEMVAEP